MRIVFGVITTCVLAGSVHAKVIEKFKCQAGTPWISGYDIVLRATVNEDQETGTIEVAGVTYQTRYSVEGLNRRWDWGLQIDGSYDYTFVLRPSGTGLYYDFSDVEPGGETTSEQSFSCK